jgi:type II secretory pathway pseudopilin PulG
MLHRQTSLLWFINKSKIAFTLAEVLLTLAIIAIIAAMTLPALTNSTNKTENIVALKKAYSTLMQAFLMITSDNGGDITGALRGITTHDDFANVFIQKLSVAKNCGTNNAKATGCFPTGVTYKWLNGTPWENIYLYYNTILTNDGISYAFGLQRNACSEDRSNGTLGTPPLSNTCGYIFIDINGPNKGPAIAGRDLFTFWVTKTGIYPHGAYSDNIVSNCSSNGYGCTSEVLLDGVMNY